MFHSLSLFTDERYDKSFQISVTIDGISEQHKPLTVLGAGQAHNRTRHLVCVRNDCEEFTVMHLGFLDYAHYIITVRFLGLESFHQKYNIRAITFYVSIVFFLHSLFMWLLYSSRRTVRSLRRLRSGFASSFCSSPL